MRSDMLKVLQCVEAGQMELAADYVQGAKKELVDLLEFNVPNRSHSELTRDIPDMVAEFYKKDPNFPGGSLAGYILIADVDHSNGSRLSFQTFGSMDKPANRIGVLQMVTTNQMEENL